ncbi:WG containing repeat-containing protein [Bizionia echini]|mgnify:CR=1 FL=1|uniref:WG containing repeat-containing protein n=1 Tax=Bizionia echini TaxID=649333 RepID=A0A1I4ZJ47_9FLAO|nr:WG repeat-containing protein [Bizionia echini]MBP93519.1 hypothetical protein [Flavobacteriaceae bacterium]SFN50315.1 WG containing repeat-containing protein [Bizionia echini]
MKTTAFFVTLLFLGIFCHAQDLALANLDGDYGYITKTGTWQIKPQFKVAKNFSDDLAEASLDKKTWGFINRKGEWVIQPQFDKTKAFNSGIAVVLKDKDWIYINKKGEQVLKDVATDKVYDFENGYAIIRKESGVGFINTKGEIVVEPKFTKVFNFENGSAKVLENDKWGLVDASGKYIVKTEYDGVSNEYNGHIVANIGERYGLIINGEFKEVPGAEKIWDFSHNAENTYAKKNDKIGFINSNGDWIIEPKFDKARAFVNGLAPVSEGKNWGYIDTSGAVIIPFQYKDAEIFSESGLAPVTTGKEWGFINTKGDLVIPEDYEITAGGFSIFSKNNPKGFIDGLARVKKKKSWTYLTPKGEPLNNLWFENLELFH